MARSKNHPADGLGAAAADPAASESFSMAELAEYLGKSRQTIYQWRARGQFPFRTFGSGRKLRVRKDEVDAYLSREGKQPTRPAAAAPAIAPRRAVQGSRETIELRLAPNCNLSEVAEFVERVRQGAETAVILGTDGCTIRVE